MVQGAACRSTQMRQRLRQYVTRILVVDGIEGKGYPEKCCNNPEAMPKLKVAGHESGLPFLRFHGAHLVVHQYQSGSFRIVSFSATAVSELLESCTNKCQPTDMQCPITDIL